MNLKNIVVLFFLFLRTKQERRSGNWNMLFQKPKQLLLPGIFTWKSYRVYAETYMGNYIQPQK